MIRVLEVIRQGQIGGGESHLMDLIYFLDKAKITPICLSFTDGEMIHRLSQMGIICYVIDTQKPFDIGIQKQIIKLIKKEGIQIIHAHGSRAASNMIFTARLLHIPFIYTVHGWSFHDDQRFWVKKLRGWSEKLICHYAHQVICVSQSNKDTGREVFGLKDAVVIDNGVNLERFNPDSRLKELRQEFGFSESDWVVGFIARCTKQKNPLIYLAALEKAHKANSTVKGLFIGEGDMDEEVDVYIEQHKMKDYLYRSPFRTDVPEVLHSIDVYCLPSLWEGLSIALLEAMAMRKAIVATPTDGTCELIHNGENGIVVPFNDSQILANAINKLATSEEKRKQYGLSARSIIEKKYDAKRVAEKVTEIYIQCSGLIK